MNKEILHTIIQALIIIKQELDKGPEGMTSRNYNELSGIIGYLYKMEGELE